MLQRRAVLSMHLCSGFQPAYHAPPDLAPSERTSRCDAHNRPHRIMSIPHRRGIDVYCFAGRYIVLEAWRTQMVAVRAAALLEHLWLARLFSTTLVCSICAGPTSEGRSPRRIRMAGSRKHVLAGFKALDFTQFVAGPTVTK